MLNPKQVLDGYFPEVRAWLIQIAAVMDRYDRAVAEGKAAPDDRLKNYQEALRVLQTPSCQPNRAERIQMIFSDPYHEGTKGQGTQGPRHNLV